MRRIRVLTDEEHKSHNDRCAAAWVEKLSEPPVSAEERWKRMRDSPPELQVSRMMLSVDQWIEMRGDMLGRNLNPAEILEVVNQARKDWGFGPVTELLGYHDEESVG